MQTNPDDVPARLALGSLYLRNGRIQDAIGQFETGLSLTNPADNDGAAGAIPATGRGQRGTGALGRG